MNKTIKKWGAFALSLLLVCTLAGSALAAETVKLDGYGGKKDASQISISNVVRKDSVTYVAGVPTYVVKAPAEITTTAELGWFSVANLVNQNGLWVEGSFLKGQGTITARDFGANQAVVTVDYNQWNNPSYDLVSVTKGAKVTLDTSGVYTVMGQYADMAGKVEAVIVVEGGNVPSVSVTATPNASKVLVNGKAVEVEAYTINENNYFKLRDVATLVTGTGKQFEVTWDTSRDAINMTSNKAYTTVGGELVKGDGAVKTGISNRSPIYKDGGEISLTAFTIKENNYFKLRDVGKTFNFNVTWDGPNNTVVINTNQPYDDK